MPCSSTSQLNNAPSPVLPLTQPQTPSQWNYFVARLQDIINSIRDSSNRQPVNVVPIAYAVYNGSALPALTVAGATAALDSTKAQFGKASLKLTATAATVTVSFSGDPIVIQPFVRWIESVYITSSRTSIAGTLAVVTPSKSYPVDISGTLIPATWGRLYGDCDLTADASTAATLTLTLTGCTVGDTFNLEGWQLEQSAGTSLPSPFVNTAAPADYVVTVQNVTTAQTTANTANANTPNVINPQFADGANGWTMQQGWIEFDGHAQYTGYAGAVNNAIYNTRLVPVTPGQQVTVQATLHSFSGAGTCGACVAWFDSNGNWLAFSSRGATVTGAAAPVVSRIAAVAPATAAYAAAAADVWSGTSGGFTADDFILTPTLTSMDELPDGSTHARTLATTLQNGVPLQFAGGKNLLPNGSFSSNLNGTPIGVPLAASGSASDGWQIGSPIAPGHQVFYESSSTGTDVLVRLVGGYVVPANAGVATLVKSIPPVAVIGAAPFAFIVTRSVANNTGALPAGITVLLRTYIQWINGDGSSAGATLLDASGNSVAAGSATATGTVPATAVAAQIILQPAYFNSTGSPIALPAGVPADMRWTSIQLVMATNLDSEVVDGTTYGRTGNADLVSSGGVNRVGLRIPGSGHTIGDQRNLLPITVASLRSVLNTSPITYAITSGSPNSTVNFSVASFTLQAGSASVSYNAASHSIAQANGTTTTWYLLFIDPGYSGGTQSLIVTTSPTVAAQYDGAVNIGNATVTVSSGGGGSGGSGSGGGGWCVCDDMWIDADTQAKDAQPGHLFDCCDLPTRGTETFQRALQSVDYHDEQCVRLTTEGGAQLDCGHTTPFDTVDGRVLRAPDMQGELVLTDDGLQRVVSVDPIGVRRVCYFHFGGISYAAGSDPHRRIYSHNAGTAKP